ncbi:hypothetical protein GH714_010826 [Hevea brasiliensis]|uniref:SAP domain-containing protein n=1 Tax=Hevea brasiliensis TaxID=3981 RepID=A0A6A6KF36_HEVBR|nr:hypothetical protein GH714_010826 [Hevea brasiliensis]
MELDPDDIFKDDEDDSDSEFYQQRESSKEFVVYLVDASPKMFSTTCPGREKRNLQDVNGVFVYNVVEREYLDRPTARLIKDFDCIEESFMKDIGSQYGILSGSRENSLYNALWVAQALLRKGSSRTARKRILLFTNEDDPFGSIKGAAKADMTRTTLQRAKDAQDLGISIELLPLGRPDEEFNVSLFYAQLIGLEDDDAQFMPSAGQKLEDMKDQLRKQMFAKRIVRRITLLIANGLSIELNMYALIRPTTPGAIMWLDSVTNRPLKEVVGSTRIFIALHRSMLRLNRFAVAYCGSSFHPRLVALVAQDEIISAGGQVEPPGMHMIYLPYTDDVRLIEEFHSESNVRVPRATDDHIKKAADLIKRIYLKDFSVCQFANPGLALEEEEIPDTIDETLPDEEGMARLGVVKAIEEFKLSVYGDKYDEESNSVGNGKANEASKKRKAAAENAANESANYDWADLADNGQLKDLTVAELKLYLTAHNLPVSGKKEALISRILTHMGK